MKNRLFCVFSLYVAICIALHSSCKNEKTFQKEKETSNVVSADKSNVSILKISKQELQDFFNETFNLKYTYDYYLPVTFSYKPNKGMFRVNFLRKDQKNKSRFSEEGYLKYVSNIEGGINEYYLVLYYRKPEDIIKVNFLEDEFKEAQIYAEKFGEESLDTIYDKITYFEYEIKRPSEVYIYVYNLEEKKWIQISSTSLDSKKKAGDTDAILDFIEFSSEKYGYEYIEEFLNL
ncbi:hypothetical protein [Aquimarina muelleri]|uniref:Uncharacterized protein n=1 Tax=Aquimarina muelleri TaxID=279356 RepID=A0A918N525_9FLAO|nr:hypothetical protein [Aquimarina muelleri]MCX2765024.1 hypothetical protein [Aquimarina muelleri]GGX33870.1 hypothetical protein GCM10007384_38260 [Aquimarina muelleri]